MRIKSSDINFLTMMYNTIQLICGAHLPDSRVSNFIADLMIMGFVGSIDDSMIW